jgi:hypothetical protein
MAMEGEVGQAAAVQAVGVAAEVETASGAAVELPVGLAVADQSAAKEPEESEAGQ